MLARAHGNAERHCCAHCGKRARRAAARHPRDCSRKDRRQICHFPSAPSLEALELVPARRNTIDMLARSSIWPCRARGRRRGPCWLTGKRGGGGAGVYPNPSRPGQRLTSQQATRACNKRAPARQKSQRPGEKEGKQQRAPARLRATIILRHFGTHTNVCNVT